MISFAYITVDTAIFELFEKKHPEVLQKRTDIVMLRVLSSRKHVGLFPIEHMIKRRDQS